MKTIDGNVFLKYDDNEMKYQKHLFYIFSFSAFQYYKVYL